MGKEGLCLCLAPEDLDTCINLAMKGCVFLKCKENKTDCSITETITPTAVDEEGDSCHGDYCAK